MKITLNKATKNALETLGFEELPTSKEINDRLTELTNGLNLEDKEEAAQISKFTKASDHLKKLVPASKDGEEIQGKSTVLNIPKKIQCPKCGGSGDFTFQKQEYVPCPHCQKEIEGNMISTGYVEVKCNKCDGSGNFTLKNGAVVKCKNCTNGIWRTVECKECHGGGVVERHVAKKVEKGCKLCDGTGEVTEKKIQWWIRDRENRAQNRNTTKRMAE